MATNLFDLPFGKYLDPNLLGELKILKHATIETHEPEDLYLIQDTKSNDLYCCFDIEGHSSGGPMNDPEVAMRAFLTEYYGDGGNFSIEMLEPKNKNWFLTCYIARVNIKV